MQSRIVACIDGSKTTSAVINLASWLSVEMDLPLLILHVLDRNTHPMVEDYSGSLGVGSQESLLSQLAELDEQRNKIALENGKKILKDAKNEAQNRCAHTVSSQQRHGSLVEILAEFEDQTSMLVIGRSGQLSETTKSQIGGHVETIIRTIKRPVLVAQPHNKIPKQILIAFDGSATMQKALLLATKSPLMKDRNCHLVMVGKNSEGKLEAAKKVLEDGGHQVKIALLTGEVDEALISYVEQQGIELMVLGAYGHSRIRQFFIGSNTTNILYKATIPLLFLR